MSMCDFLEDAVKGTLLTATAIVALPVLGAVGTISVPGAAIAVALGTTTSAIDHSSKDD